MADITRDNIRPTTDVRLDRSAHQKGREDERAAILAWMRAMAALAEAVRDLPPEDRSFLPPAMPSLIAEWIRNAGEAIERGDHLTGEAVRQLALLRQSISPRDSA